MTSVVNILNKLDKKLQLLIVAGVLLVLAVKSYDAGNSIGRFIYNVTH